MNGRQAVAEATVEHRRLFRPDAIMDAGHLCILSIKMEVVWWLRLIHILMFNRTGTRSFITETRNAQNSSPILRASLVDNLEERLLEREHFFDQPDAR